MTFFSTFCHSLEVKKPETQNKQLMRLGFFHKIYNFV